MLALLLLLAAPTPAEVLHDLQQTVQLGGVTISRDGQRAAWVEQVQTPDGPSWEESLIHVRDATGTRRVTASKDGKPHEEGELDFSPDGSELAFISDAEEKSQTQLYVASLSTGAVRQLTHAKGHLSHPHWSPDGRTIAVFFIEGVNDVLGPLRAAARQTGVVGETPHEQRIALVAADGSAPMQPVSPADLYVYEASWRPDSQGMVGTAAHGSGDDNWWIAKLFSFDLRGGAKVIYEPKWQLCEPRVSPDGKRVAFIEGLMSDQGSNGGDLIAMDLDGGHPKNLTKGFRGSPATVRWTSPGSIVVGAQIAGDSAFVRVGLDGRREVLWRGPYGVSSAWPIGAAFSADGAITAAVKQSFTEPPEVVLGPIGQWKPITASNVGRKSPAASAQSLTWKSDRFEVQGWLIAPPLDEHRSGRLPMVVLVHGGPAAAVRPGWSDTALLLASQGYFVFQPNPRGSFGQGEAFTRANIKDFGHGDLRDILRGVDKAVASAPIDPARVGLYGHSYGGYMAMWAVTQTNRFRASVASAGLSNWQSYYGENLIDQWMIPYFGKSVYEDPQAYARSSPIEYIRKVKTPTLVLHGERDAEVPLPQGQEFWHALKALGVPTQLVVYPDEGHRLRKPEHIRDRMERIVGWFDKYLKEPPRKQL
jgi:dipeptidyl aminopeptidase/acylaminoacyl peptidase